MKKLLTLLLLFPLFISCSSDDEHISDPRILGQWMYDMGTGYGPESFIIIEDSKISYYAAETKGSPFIKPVDYRDPSSYSITELGKWMTVDGKSEEYQVFSDSSIAILYVAYKKVNGYIDLSKSLNLPSQELEKKLVGQWSDEYKGENRGTLYRFYEDNTFQQYDVLRYDLTPKTIKKNTSSWSSGKYWIEGNYLYLDGAGTTFTFYNDTVVGFGRRLMRDFHNGYVEVE